MKLSLLFLVIIIVALLILSFTTIIKENMDCTKSCPSPHDTSQPMPADGNNKRPGGVIFPTMDQNRSIDIHSLHYPYLNF
jgi:hypothetical protein